MKKKGLIISTIVMVVVLIASLTTATYAWFNNHGTAKVDNIDFSVQSATSVMIGVNKDNAYDSTKTLTNFVSGGTSFNTSTDKWTGTNGLGLEVHHNINLRMEKAVYSFDDYSESGHNYYNFTAGSGEGAKTGAEWKEQFPSADYNYTGTLVDETSYTMAQSLTAGAINCYSKSEGAGTIVGTVDTYTGGQGTAISAGINMAHTILKASGEGSAITPGSLEATGVNEDYVNIAFGALASKTNVLGYGMVVYIQPTDDQTALGINAAIHVAYNLNNSGWTEIDVYGANDRNTVKSSMTAPTAPSWTAGSAGAKQYSATGVFDTENTAAGDAYVYIPLYESADGTACAPIAAANLNQIQLVVYLCGQDEDCVTASTGVSATVTIEFVALEKTA